MMINKNALFYIPGSTGLVGSAVKKCLIECGYTNILQTFHHQYDLRKQLVVQKLFEQNKIQYVIDCAAVVGGILANMSFPYQFLYDNLMIQSNLIDCSLRYKIKKFIFLGSSCIYPKHSPQPIKEQYLLTSKIEQTNEWYAIAKITGLKLCQAIHKQYDREFISLMPTNLYGPNDNFDLQSGHVIPAMMRKFHEALPNKDVHLLGSGAAYRQFLHVSDLARCIQFVISNDIDSDIYNVGAGEDLQIRELAQLIQKIVGHTGNIIWGSNDLDGMSRKVLDVSKINNLGWKYKISLSDGLQSVYSWFLNNQPSIRNKHFL